MKMSPNSKPHNPIKRPPMVGRVTPCAPFGLSVTTCGAHGVTRPTLRFMERRKQLRPPTAGSPRAFTLIEMIAVMTEGVILALALVTVVIKHLDQIAADKETTQLKTFADAFRLGVIRG